MNNPAHATQSLVPHDYRRALQKAVSWLGDRYLLAAPQPRRADEHPKYWTAPQHAAAYHLKQARFDSWAVVRGTRSQPQEAIYFHRGNSPEKEYNNVVSR